MIDESLKSQLQGYLARLARPVELLADVDDGESSRGMLELLRAVVALDPRLSLVERRDGVGRRPGFGVAAAGEAPRVHFAGVPLGHEFSSFVLALLQAGGHPPKVPAGAAEQARSLQGELRFETYVSLGCQNCPEVVQALNALALLNPNVTHTMVDGALFQQEIAQRQVMAVPAVFLNGQPFGQGRMGLEEILTRLDSGSAARTAAQLEAKRPFDVLVIGGGPAGAAAAIYAARKGIRTGVAAERFGGQVLDTLAIENFVSVRETEGPQLAAGLEEHVRSYDVDIMNLQRARALVPGELLEVQLESGATLRSRTVVIATGARWRELGVPGERDYRNRGVAYCPHCDGPLFKGRDVAVVGGGNSGVEAAIDLAGIVRHVTLIEFEAQLRADAVLVRRLRSLANVTVITGAQTTAIEGDGQRVTGLVYTDRATGEPRRVTLAGVFVQIGLVPNTDWLRGTLQLSARGEIEVDARGQTSVPGVFAAGDATTVPFKQIVIAMGEGARAALGAFDHLIRTPLAAPVSQAA